MKVLENCRKSKAVTILITALTIVIVDNFKIPNPAIICLIGVVFSLFIGGYLYGIISGCMTLGYCAYFFSDKHSFIYYTDENKYKLLVIVLALVTMILMVGVLKKRLEKQTKELEITNHKLLSLSITDELTELYNYRHFTTILNNEWGKSLRNQTSLSIAIIDIDYFKKYNDYYGHPAGNDCLRQLARLIKQQTNRITDFVARYGGEEFAIILPDTDAEGANVIMEKIHSAIANQKIEHKTAGRFPYLTVSIGVATMIPEQGQTYEMLIKQADAALYNAKQNGRNRVVQYAHM